MYFEFLSGAPTRTCTTRRPTQVEKTPLEVGAVAQTYTCFAASCITLIIVFQVNVSLSPF